MRWEHTHTHTHTHDTHTHTIHTYTRYTHTHTHTTHTHQRITFFRQSKEAKKHLEIVKSERSLYKSLCKTSTSTLKTHFGEDLQQLPPPGAMVPVNTHIITLHYSFDMAQQVKFTQLTEISSSQILTGALSIQPVPTWAHLFSYDTEVRNF